MGEVKSLAELLAEPPRRGNWGPWQLDPEVPALFIPRDLDNPVDGDDLYWWPLDKCCDSPQVLDFLFQVNAKTWATVEIRAGLLNALDDVLDPQANLCSFGMPGGLNVAQIRARAIEVSKWPAA